MKDRRGAVRSPLYGLPTLLILQVLGGRCRAELRRFAARAPGLASDLALAVRSGRHASRPERGALSAAQDKPRWALTLPSSPRP